MQWEALPGARARCSGRPLPPHGAGPERRAAEQARRAAGGASQQQASFSHQTAPSQQWRAGWDPTQSKTPQSHRPPYVKDDGVPQGEEWPSERVGLGVTRCKEQ